MQASSPAQAEEPSGDPCLEGDPSGVGAERGFLGKKKKSNNTKQQVIPETPWAGRNPQGNRLILEHPGRLPGGGNLATDTREKKGSKMEGEGLGDQAPGRCWG